LLRRPVTDVTNSFRAKGLGLIPTHSWLVEGRILPNY